MKISRLLAGLLLLPLAACGNNDPAPQANPQDSTAAYQNCLRDHGVTVPSGRPSGRPTSFPSGRPTARPSRSPGETPSPRPSRSAGAFPRQSMPAECASLRPQRGNGNGFGGNGFGQPDASPNN